MSERSTSVRIQGPAGSIDLFLSRPAGPGPWPALVLGHEGVGVTAWIKDLARRFAAEGYLAVVPDLYSRDEERKGLGEEDTAVALAAARSADPEAAIQALPESRRTAARRILEWFRSRDTSNYLTDFLAATSWVKQHPEARTDRVGALGFSFGAGLVGRLAASGADLAAGVIVYGPVPAPAEAERVRFPLLGHFAAEDTAINLKVPGFAAALQGRGIGFAYEVHAGTSHGFFNRTRPSYDARAAARAWDSVLAFLARHLQDTLPGPGARPDSLPGSGGRSGGGEAAVQADSQARVDHARRPSPEPERARGARAFGIRPRAHGPAEGLSLSDLSVPDPGPGQVLVRNEFAGVNYIDIYHRTGAFPVETPIPLGVEGAGTIAAAGPGVEDFAAGDRIAWIGTPGSYASHVVVDAAKAIPLPHDIDTETGAAVALQGLTAHALAFSAFPLRPGHTALVHAAAGGVGLLLVQLAKSAGARVLATVSTESKADLVRKAGADHVLLYGGREDGGREDFAAEARRLTDGAGVSVVYDSVGKDTFLGSLDALAVRGFLVLYGQSSGKVPALDPQILAKRSLTLSRVSIGHYTRTRVEFLQRAHDLFARIRAGRLSVRIDRTVPLAEAAEAHRALESRETSGKILLAVAGDVP